MCPMCSVGYHTSCIGGECGCADTGHKGVINAEQTSEHTDRLDSDTSDLDDQDSSDRSGRSNRNSDNVRSVGTVSHRLKRDAALKDQQSTGRKRAARMYPLTKGAPCEWRDRANCGGGPYPIVGCLGGTQEARHHGPDKSVSNNDEGNVHRICHRCHYQWHARNNSEYDWNSTSVQSHQPRPMTDEDRVLAFQIDAKYNATKEKRIKIKD